MAISPQDTYLEDKILSADPVELVRMLYRAAIEAVERARRHLAANEIPERSTAIVKAVEILAELDGALDHQRAPEVSRRLSELYDYMERRLLSANCERADAPLVEVLRHLEPLAEAWNAVPLSRPAEIRTAPAAARDWNPAPPSGVEPALHGWSF